MGKPFCVEAADTGRTDDVNGKSNFVLSLIMISDTKKKDIPYKSLDFRYLERFSIECRK